MEYKHDDREIECRKERHPGTWKGEQSVDLVAEECAHGDECKAVCPELFTQETYDEYGIDGSVNEEIKHREYGDLWMGDIHQLECELCDHIIRIFNELTVREHDDRPRDRMGAKDVEQHSAEEIKDRKDTFADDTCLKE